jgi:hypothetical protein
MSQEGVVAPEDYERLRPGLRERLEALGDDQGRLSAPSSTAPEDLCPEGAAGIAPADP